MFKKSLVAVAVLGAVAFSAQAADVQLYGRIDTGVRYTNIDADVANQDDVSKFEMSSGNFTGNRFGLKATEDLGNGMKVGFVLENGFNSDDGALKTTKKLFDREANLFVTSDFGTLSAGRVGILNGTAGSYAIGNFNPFGTGWGDVGNQGLLWGAGFDSRYDNMLTYVTPDFAGFKVYAQYSFGENGHENKSSTNRYAALGATYTVGGLNVIGIVDTINKKSYDSTTKTTSDVDDTYRVTVGGSYDFGMVKPFVAVGYFKDGKIGDLLGTWAAEANHKANLDRYYDGYGLTLGASMPAFAGTAHAMVGYMDAEYASEANGTVTSGRQIDVTRFVLGAGYEYPLSKRTLVYADLGYFKDEVDAANDKFDYKPEAYQAAVGLVHKF